jgi:hypothetical protein
MNFPGCEAALLTALAYKAGQPFPDAYGELGDGHYAAAQAWWKCESGAQGDKGGKNNPWACTLAYGGSKPVPGNTAGVQNYKSRFDGIAATVKVLTTSQGYPEITAALLESAIDLDAFCTAIGSDTGAQGLGVWGTDEACVRSVLGI